MIDLNKGEMVWQTSLPERATKGLRMSVAVSGDTVAVGWPGEEDRGGSAGYRISTGKKLWSAPPSGCASEEHAGGTALVTISVCGRDSKVGGTRYVAGCGYTQPNCGAVMVTGSTLYMATHDFSDSNKIVSFDIKSGKEKWSYRPATEVFQTLIPVQTQGEGLVVHSSESTLRGSELLHLVGDGTPKRLLKREDGLDTQRPEADMLDSDVRDRPYYADGRLFLHYSEPYFYSTKLLTVVLTTT